MPPFHARYYDHRPRGRVFITRKILAHAQSHKLSSISSPCLELQERACRNLKVARLSCKGDVQDSYRNAAFVSAHDLSHNDLFS